VAKMLGCINFWAQHGGKYERQDKNVARRFENANHTAVRRQKQAVCPSLCQANPKKNWTGGWIYREEPRRAHYLAVGMVKWQMSNVLLAFLGNLHAKPRPFPSYALNATTLSSLCAIFTNANTLILVSEFSGALLFFSLLFSALEEEDQLLHTNALAFEWATIAVCLCEYYLCSALEIYLHRTTNLSSANAE